MRVSSGLSSLALLTLTSLLDGSSGQTCIQNLQEIYDAESQVADVSDPRTYVLCPRRVYNIGGLDVNFDVTGFDKNPPLPIRPNIRYLCGDKGDRNDLCWIADGDVHMDATFLRGLNDLSVENVLIQGFVFINALHHALWASKPGDITFRDCEFRDFKNSTVPVLLDWFDGTDSSLSVTFEDCWFHDNRYHGWGSNTALIYGNSAQTSVTVRRTIFDHNDMVWNNTLSETNSFIIETLGPLTVERSCFMNNTVGVSNVVVFGNKLVDSQVHMQNSTGNICGFASVFENLQQFDKFTPLCVSASDDVCAALSTDKPSMTPTDMPTPLQSAGPSEATPSPTAIPTISPAPSKFGDTKEPQPVGFQWPTENPGDGASGARLVRPFLNLAAAVLIGSFCILY